MGKRLVSPFGEPSLSEHQVSVKDAMDGRTIGGFDLHFASFSFRTPELNHFLGRLF